MFDHVTIRAADRKASRCFYDAVLEPLGHLRTRSGGQPDEWGEFGLAEGNGEATRRLHVGFVARSRDEVDAFWRAGVEAGSASDGEPGLRPVYHADYYGAFLLDPGGNSVEAVFHGRLREPGNVIDHLWLRVADLEASKGFWEAVAGRLGLGVRRSDRAERVHVERGDRSFALLPGVPTEHVHLAFPVPDHAAVAKFHRAALAAGYRDGGPPGAASHHAGSHAAFVLDPDGNNVEAVQRDRGGSSRAPRPSCGASRAQSAHGKMIPMQIVGYPNHPEPSARMIGAAIERGGVGVIPTDTVYGLVCLPSWPEAVQRVFALKARPPEQRLPVIVGSQAEIDSLGVEFGDAAARVAAAFWPGPLTIVVGVREPKVDWLAGRDEVAIRMPESDLVTSLTALVGPFLMTSANRHGTRTQSTLRAVLLDLAGSPDVAVDGGPLSVVSSTLVNVNLPEPVIEREGAVPAAAVMDVLRG